MKNHVRIVLTVLSVFIALVFISCGGGKPSAEVKDSVKSDREDRTEPKTDDDFATSAADGGLLEVQAGKLAMSIGSSAEIKALGQMMVTDHTKLNDQLTLLAQKRNITLPGKLSHKNQEKYDALVKKTGVDFDKTYASLMVAAHDEDIAAFRKEAEKGKDADMKSWAEGEIPLLEHHLEVSNAALHAKN